MENEPEQMNVEITLGGDSASTLRQIRDLGLEGWQVVSQILLANTIFFSLVREAPRNLPV